MASPDDHNLGEAKALQSLVLHELEKHHDNTTRGPLDSLALVGLTFVGMPLDRTVVDMEKEKAKSERRGTGGSA